MMKLTELFNLATKGWPMDEAEILRKYIQSQPENRAAWIETLKCLVEFEINVAKNKPNATQM